MLCCLSRRDNHILTIGVVLGGSYIKLVVTFVDVLHQHRTFLTGGHLLYQCTGIVVAEFHGCIGHIGVFTVFVTVDGVLVANLYQQGTLVLADHLHIEVHGNTVALFAVDGNITLLHKIHVHIRTRIETKHNGSAVVGLEGWYLCRSSQREE